jgi:hypothetical protein
MQILRTMFADICTIHNSKLFVIEMMLLGYLTKDMRQYNPAEAGHLATLCALPLFNSVFRHLDSYYCSKKIILIT